MDVDKTVLLEEMLVRVLEQCIHLRRSLVVRASEESYMMFLSQEAVKGSQSVPANTGRPRFGSCHVLTGVIYTPLHISVRYIPT